MRKGLRLQSGHLLSPAACFWHWMASQNHAFYPLSYSVLVFVFRLCNKRSVWLWSNAFTTSINNINVYKIYFTFVLLIFHHNLNRLMTLYFVNEVNVRSNISKCHETHFHIGYMFKIWIQINYSLPLYYVC